MENMFANFEHLKLSAFSKLEKLNGNINNITLGPDSIKQFKQNIDHVDKIATIEEPQIKRQKSPKQQTETYKTDLMCNSFLKELEYKRQETVEKAVQSHYNKFEEFSKILEANKQQQWLAKQQGFIANVQQQELNILEALEEYDSNKINRNEELTRHYQDMNKRKLKIQQQLIETKQKQRLLNENIEKIRKSQIEFRQIYQEIIGIIKSCECNEELKSSLSEVFKQLKILPELMEEIIGKCKSYKIDESQVNKAMEIVELVKGLKQKIQTTVTEINTKTAKTLQVTEISKEHNLNNVTTTTLASSDNVKNYLELKTFVENYNELFKQLLNDSKLKQFITDCKHAVNFNVNSLLKVEDLKEKYTKLHNLLAGKPVQIVGGRQVNASQHPQGTAYCTDLLAKKFILQGLLMTSGNQHSAFCYAKIIISLWLDFPDFGKLTLAYFLIYCPCLVPLNVPKADNESDLDVYIKQVYDFTKGKLKIEAELIKGMSEMMRIYFAMSIANPVQNQKNPYDIRNAWKWLISLLKLEPRSNITAIALYSFFSTIGFQMEIVYGVVFRRVVVGISQQFIPVLKKIDVGGSASRLENLLQEYLQVGHFEKPIGVLNDNIFN